jgi:hypothetical protein
MNEAKNTSLEALNAHQARMQKAFDIVANPLDWKAPIRVQSSRATWAKLLSMTGLTHDEILESIAYFTATTATVTEQGDELEITAPGYRAGPAGDH